MELTLKKKIGQMISAGFPSTFVDEQARAMVEKLEVGNFYLFARNLDSARQITELTNGLNELAFRAHGVAPFIATDQEGGAVSRLMSGAALFPGAMAQGAAGGRFAYECGKNCGRILRAMGITTTASPVLDVNVEPLNPIIGTRAFGDDPEKVSEYGIAMMKGLADGGVIATVKHYPGHGNVKSDSHLALPINDTKTEFLEKTEWAPFQNAFRAGADALMTAHVVYTDYDPDYPGTVSKKILTGLLREKQGFGGIVETDCMEMDAVRATYGTGEASVMAIEAGADLLTISHTLGAVEEAVNAICGAVESGRLSEERIDLSVKRILAVKEKYGLLNRQTASFENAQALLADEGMIALHRRASMESITLLKDEGGLASLMRAKNPAFFAPLSFALNMAEEQKKTPLSFAKACGQAFGGRAYELPLNEFSEEIRKVIAEADFDCAVLGLYNARFREAQRAILSALEGVGRPLTVVLLGAPYDFPLIGGADSVVAAYEYTHLSVDSAIQALRTHTFKGNLPVRL